MILKHQKSLKNDQKWLKMMKKQLFLIPAIETLCNYKNLH